MSALKNHWSAISSVWGKRIWSRGQRTEIQFFLIRLESSGRECGLAQSFAAAPFPTARAALREMTQDQSCLQQQSDCKANHHHSAWAARLQVTTHCGVCCCARAAQALSKARTSLPTPLCEAAADWALWKPTNRFCSSRSLWTGNCLAYFLWEQEGCWTMGVMESSSPGRACPGHTLLNTQQCKTLLCSTWVQDVAPFSPQVCVSPHSHSHYLKRNLKISSSGSSQCVPLPMSSSGHPAPSKQSGILLSPISCKAASLLDSPSFSEGLRNLVLYSPATQQSTQDLCPPTPERTWDHPCCPLPTLYIFFFSHFPHSCSWRH